MQQAAAATHKFGRVLIEIRPHSPDGLEASVTRTCNKPEIIELAEALVKELVRLSPGIVIKKALPESKPVIAEREGRRRGGPVPTPQDEKMKVVKGWLQVQGRVNQELYARRQGIAPSTLRRWIRQLRREGKL